MKQSDNLFTLISCFSERFAMAACGFLQPKAFHIPIAISPMKPKKKTMSKRIYLLLNLLWRPLKLILRVLNLPFLYILLMRTHDFKRQRKTENMDRCAPIFKY
eukprot:Gb_07314 [translate_table: standard]